MASETLDTKNVIPPPPPFRPTFYYKDVDAISKFAQFEFQYGEYERGATEFESLVSTYPKRVDLWSVYIDMMLKKGEVKKVRYVSQLCVLTCLQIIIFRELFERAIHLKISAKKMAFMFKRYVEFEKAHGSNAHVESVREKAKSYVESKALPTEKTN